MCLLCKYILNLHLFCKLWRWVILRWHFIIIMIMIHLLNLLLKIHKLMLSIKLLWQRLNINDWDLRTSSVGDPILNSLILIRWSWLAHLQIRSLWSLISIPKLILITVIPNDSSTIILHDGLVLFEVMSLLWKELHWFLVNLLQS